MTLRHLIESEVQELKARGCTAEEWQRIRVQEGFTPGSIQNVHFSGNVSLGCFQERVTLPGGQQRPSGIYNATIHHCDIASHVFIANVGLLANYNIGQRAKIQNVQSLTVEGESAFGNGVEIDVLNEAGGRTIPIFDRLSAQLAYMMVFYRHRPALIDKLKKMIDAYVAYKRSDQGILGAGCRIFNSGEIKNVAVGPCAVIEGAVRLEEGTLVSNSEAPAYVGCGVMAKKFIILSGAKVDEGALITSSLVGQSVKMGKQYSAENSLFFANSELFHGEGCSVFAGPYTVTHHKSSLLIAGFFSFFNAGSGTNQSNHMYKLGPVHQGIVERGSKTGSFSYLLWPSRVGPYTTVLGKHYANFDAGDLPFSFIDEEKGKSVIVPAMNLFTVGTRRDSAKWPRRDKRTDSDKLDLIHFGLFTPYTVGRMVKGEAALRKLMDDPKKREYVNYKGILIHRLMLRTSAKYYKMAISIYLGEALIRRISEEKEKGGRPSLGALLNPGPAVDFEWTDVCGMLTPQSVLDCFLNEIESGQVPDLEAMFEKLAVIAQSYDDFEWSWWLGLARSRLNKNGDALSKDDLKTLVENWETQSVKLNAMVMQDARKEFDDSAAIGFGKDGDDSVRALDFAAVRGKPEDNSFIQSLEEDTQNKKEIASQMTAWLDTLEN